jgi:hypothetical protein
MHVRIIHRLGSLMIIGAIALSGLALAARAAEEITLYPPLEMGAISQQIPAGARLKVRFLSAMDSRTANIGDPFVANASEDLWSQDHLLIPNGTVIRGRVQAVQRPGLFSKGGLIRLAFDHVAMPSGELKPLPFQVDAASAKMNREKNALYTDPGIGSKLNTSVDKGIAQFKGFHERGIKAGQERGGGINMLLTVPTNTVAGVATGTAVTTFHAAKAVLGRGESLVIQPGDELILDFSQPATLQNQ